MSDWDEIKRLAADFQRTQTTDTLQRISERNCIDIIKKLTDLNLIELIYTCDGKEFLTPAHLLKEIEDEIYVNGGRMHLHDLAANLNVDYQHVENKAKELARNKPDEYSVILGQVIHSAYKTTLGRQISDCMLSVGQLSIAEFAKSLDLPSEFLLSIVKELLPKVMDDYVVGQDERTYYTTDMMDKYKSVIAGTLSAIIKPTSIASLMKRLDIQERIFLPIVDSLIKEGRIDASIENRLFIPTIYARNQNERVDEFYSSNSYIGYDLLARWDIKQPKAFLKKRYPDGIQLKTCMISPELFSQIESLVEDTLTSNGWIDISNGSYIPTAIEPEDIEQLLQDIMKKNKQLQSSCVIINKTFVCSLGFIATSKKSFSNLMNTKIEEDLKQGKLINYFLGGRTKQEKPSVDEKNKDAINETKADEASQEDLSKSTSKSEDQRDAPREPEAVGEESQPSGRANKKDKKEKRLKAADFDESDETDEEQGTKKSKGRKSGGGTQGREIKQKSVKKKYLAGKKGNQKSNDMSDDETKVSSKTPRSNKGRAARRGISPETPSKAAKGKQSNSSETPQKEPLIFLSTEKIVEKLRDSNRGSDEGSEEFFEEIAKTIENELNETYETLARQKLDEFMKSQAEVDNDNDNELELVN